MRAVVIDGPGGPDKLVLAQMADPVPGEGEVLVEVAFAGCNWADTQIRAGRYRLPFPFPLVLGLEISGRIAALGRNVSGLRVGDRVAGFVEAGGGYAERCVAPANSLIPLAEAIPLDVGAAFPIQALTAYHMLHTVHDLQPGEAVLVHAIGGGVGLHCTQLAAKAGARVIGTVGTAAKARRALEFGAERVVVRGDEDFEAAALDFTGGRGVDLAIDSLGGATLDRTFDAVKKLGHIVSIGEAEGEPLKNIRERLMVRSQTFTRLHLGHVEPESEAWRDGVAHVVRGILDGWLKVPIEGVYPMAEAAEMHRRLESRQVAGKLLLAIAP